MTTQTSLFRFSPSTESVVISTPNSNLDGSGTITTLVSGSNNGTFVDQLVIKSQSSNTQGMIRLFLSDGTDWFLIREIRIPANTLTSLTESFVRNIALAIDLAPGFSLGVATEKGEAFSITAIATTYTSCNCI